MPTPPQIIPSISRGTPLALAREVSATGPCRQFTLLYFTLLTRFLNLETLDFAWLASFVSWVLVLCAHRAPACAWNNNQFYQMESEMSGTR